VAEKIAIPTWNGQISPVFDTAQEILVLGPEEEPDQAQRVCLAEVLPQARARRLRELGVGVLLCGAISRPLAWLLMSQGIEVIPNLSGSVKEVIAAFRRGEAPLGQYLMPGCRGFGFGPPWLGGPGPRRGRFRRGRGWGCGFGPWR